MPQQLQNRLTKIEAAWEFVAEDIADLWVDGVELEGNTKERAVELADDLEHFVMRLRELTA